MPMILIAFGHRARVGKDTAVATLLAHYKGKISIRRYAFADELKRMLCIVPGEVLSAGRRQQCQALGVKMREKDPEFLIKKVALLLQYEPPDVALISDLRYNNEFAWVKGMGGKTIKLVRHGLPEDPQWSGHISEQELTRMPDAMWDKVLAASSVAELQEKVLTWFSAIIVPQLELAGLIRQNGTASPGEDHANVVSPPPILNLRV